VTYLPVVASAVGSAASTAADAIATNGPYIRDGSAHLAGATARALASAAAYLSHAAGVYGSMLAVGVAAAASTARATATAVTATVAAAAAAAVESIRLDGGGAISAFAAASMGALSVAAAAIQLNLAAAWATLLSLTSTPVVSGAVSTATGGAVSTATGGAVSIPPAPSSTALLVSVLQNAAASAQVVTLTSAARLARLSLVVGLVAITIALSAGAVLWMGRCVATWWVYWQRDVGAAGASFWRAVAEVREWIRREEERTAQLRQRKLPPELRAALEGRPTARGLGLSFPPPPTTAPPSGAPTEGSEPPAMGPTPAEESLPPPPGGGDPRVAIFLNQWQLRQRRADQGARARRAKEVGDSATASAPASAPRARPPVTTAARDGAGIGRQPIQLAGDAARATRQQARSQSTPYPQRGSDNAR
jgi:hypothetical protein